MSVVLTLIKKEFRSTFLTPMGYTLLAIFMIVIGAIFFNFLSVFQDIPVSLTSGKIIDSRKLNLHSHLIQPLFGVIISFGLFIIPLLTMKTFSEERKNKTIKILLSLPITCFQIVQGKFIAFMIYIIILLSSSLPFIFIVVGFGNPELWPIITGYLGIFLLFSSFGATGIFFSSLFENQFLSACLSFFTILLFWLLNQIVTFDHSSLSQLSQFLSYGKHTFHLINGVIYLSDVGYFFLLTSFFLYLTYRQIEAHKWR